MSFDQTLEQHINALQTKNLDVFLETVPHTGDLTLILLNGRLIASAEEFVAMHREWFGDPDWAMAITVIRKVVGSDLGFALLDVAYDDVDREGQPIHKTYFLQVVFRRHEDGRWLLTHDQNTGK
jgi:ketosteroid isomerase-like protein